MAGTHSQHPHTYTYTNQWPVALTYITWTCLHAALIYAARCVAMLTMTLINALQSILSILLIWTRVWWSLWPASVAAGGVRAIGHAGGVRAKGHAGGVGAKGHAGGMGAKGHVACNIHMHYHHSQSTPHTHMDSTHTIITFTALLILAG